MAMKLKRKFKQNMGDSPMADLGGGGRCFRLSWKWLACQVTEIEFFRYKEGRVHDDLVTADFGPSFRKYMDTRENAEGKYTNTGLEYAVPPRKKGDPVTRTGPWLHGEDSDEYAIGKWDLVRNPYKSSQKAAAYRKAALEQYATERSWHRVEHDFLEMWCEKWRQKNGASLRVLGDPIPGTYPATIRDLVLKAQYPIAFVHSACRHDAGHATAFYKRAADAKALFFDSLQEGEYEEENPGDAIVGILETGLSFYPDSERAYSHLIGKL